MDKSDIFRLGGLAAILAGVWTAASSFVSFGDEGLAWLFFAGTVLSMFALFTVFAAQAEPSGAWGLGGFALASVGNILFLGETTWGEAMTVVAGTIYALGLVLLAVGTLRGGVFSRWVGWLWIGAVLVGLPAFAVPALTAAGFMLGGLAFGAAFVLAGYQLWAGRTDSRTAG